jgi:hypothetical protein
MRVRVRKSESKFFLSATTGSVGERTCCARMPAKCECLSVEETDTMRCDAAGLIFGYKPTHDVATPHPDTDYLLLLQ